MNAQELRIGNWVSIPECGITAQVDIIGEKKVCINVDPVDLNKNQNDFLLTSIEPIPLTPELLEKCGFKNAYTAFHDGNFVMNLKGERLDFQYGSKYNKGLFVSDKGQDDAMIFPCQYLHQLQNLIFSLTGTELEITL